MADGSRYLKCDGCGAVFDRRPAGDCRDGGSYRYGQERELFAYAKSLGWTWDGEGQDHRTKHLCPACSPIAQHPKDPTA